MGLCSPAQTSQAGDAVPHPREGWRLLQLLPGQPNVCQPVDCDLFQGLRASLPTSHQLITFNCWCGGKRTGISPGGLGCWVLV